MGKLKVTTTNLQDVKIIEPAVLEITEASSRKHIQKEILKMQE